MPLSRDEGERLRAVVGLAAETKWRVEGLERSRERDRGRDTQLIKTRHAVYGAALLLLGQGGVTALIAHFVK